MKQKRRPLFRHICSSSDLAEALLEQADWFTGVPDSVFKQVIPRIHPYVAAPRENHALAMCFGARLGGRKPCVLMQNSGLGLSGDVIYGLHRLYKVGVLIVVSVRGELEWEEPQHRTWGSSTEDFLKVLGIRSFDLMDKGMPAVRKAAIEAFRQEKPVALLIHRGNIDE